MAFGAAPRARRQGLSAVFSTGQIGWWDFASRQARLIRNPWATAPLPPLDLGVGEYVPEGEQFQSTVGAKMGELLGLPEV